MVISPNNVESGQLEEGCDTDRARVLLQFPKQRGVRRFCFMYSIGGRRAASDLPVRFGSPGRSLTGWRESAAKHSEGQPCFRTSGRGPQPCSQARRFGPSADRVGVYCPRMYRALFDNKSQ